MVKHSGSYPEGKETRFKVKANYETRDGSEATSAETELVCYVGGKPATPTPTPTPAATPNRTPTVTNAIADATIVHEGGTQSVSLSGVFSDADSDALTVTAASSDEAKATVSVASDYSGSDGIGPEPGNGDDHGNGGTVQDTFTVTVKAAPEVASALADVSGLAAGTTQEVSLPGVFSDADNDSLTVNAGSSDENVATVSVAGDYSALTLAGVVEGTATITVTALDGDDNRVSDALTYRWQPRSRWSWNCPRIRIHSRSRTETTTATA